jgi:hypothetical protein
MATSYWKTLKTVNNLAEKPDNIPGTCLILANSFLGCDQIWLNFQESAKEYFLLKFFLGENLHQFAREKKRLHDIKSIYSQKKMITFNHEFVACKKFPCLVANLEDSRFFPFGLMLVPLTAN